MFRKSLNTVVAAAVALTGVAGPASAQTFMFRYNTPVSLVTTPENVPEAEFSIGNDIVAYYVAPVGYAFEKKIPVATQDVVEWRKESGSAPDGVDLDVRGGKLSGEATTQEETEVLYFGYDRGGKRIAKAEIHFTTFKPVGERIDVDFYAHTGTYFYGQIPNPKNASVARWEPVVPYAKGLSMMGQALQGVAEDVGNWGVAWRGYDYLDREVSFAYGDLVVESGPVVEQVVGSETTRTFSDQIADKNIGQTWTLSGTHSSNTVSTLETSLSN